MDIELEPAEMSGYHSTSISPKVLEVNLIKAWVDHSFDNAGKKPSVDSSSSCNSIMQSMGKASRSISLDAERKWNKIFVEKSVQRMKQYVLENGDSDGDDMTEVVTQLPVGESYGSIWNRYFFQQHLIETESESDKETGV